jgi:hypothetical protein
MPKIKICTEPGCKNTQTTKHLCRLHYLKNWKKLKEESQKKAADRLNRYVEGLCKKNPERYMDQIRRDIRTGKGEGIGLDEPLADDSDISFEDTGLKEEDNIDKLISHIKLDKDF